MDLLNPLSRAKRVFCIIAKSTFNCFFSCSRYRTRTQRIEVKFSLKLPHMPLHKVKLSVLYRRFCDLLKIFTNFFCQIDSQIDVVHSNGRGFNLSALYALFPIVLIKQYVNNKTVKTALVICIVYL